jgi:hypothetical protein
LTIEEITIAPGLPGRDRTETFGKLERSCGFFSGIPFEILDRLKSRGKFAGLPPSALECTLRESGAHSGPHHDNGMARENLQS